MAKKVASEKPLRTFVYQGEKIQAKSFGHAMSLLRRQGAIQIVDVTTIVNLPEETKKVLIDELKS